MSVRGTVFLLAFVVAGPACAQAPVLFSPDQFGKVDLVPNQRGGADAGLLESLGAKTDRFEPVNGFSEKNKYRVLGRSIGRLQILLKTPGGGEGVATCTAALIAPDRLITNYHCVPGSAGDIIEKVEIDFLYLDLGTSTMRAFAVEPAPVEADKALDYAILKVAGDPVGTAGITPLAVKPRAVQNNESLFLIHHPAGQPQRLTRAFCRAHATKAIDGTAIRHLCDTLPGSSGALVFADDDFALVGLHHAGGLSPGDASSFNEGIDVMALEGKSRVLAGLAKGGQTPRPDVASKSDDAQGSDPIATAPVSPSPLVGEGQGGGDGRTTAIVVPPTPNPSPQGGGGRSSEPKAAMLEPPTPNAAPVACTGVETAVGNEKRCLKPGDVFRDCPDCPEMVVIPAGSFTMGSPRNAMDSDDDEGPQHMVTIAKPFAAGKFEVTFAEWDACAAAAGCKTKPDGGWGRDRHPVNTSSWNDAHEYAAWLSKKTGQTYRLLSEAEWEYAARAGTTTKYAFGDTITKQQAQFSEGRGSAGKTVEVGSFKPNAFGLYDMHGNVEEGVEDCYHDNYAGAPSDGTAVTTGDCQDRVSRGGSWRDDPGSLSSARRYTLQPEGRTGDVGFRLARTLVP